MMHFFVRSKIHVDCFTSRISVIEGAPIDHAIKHIPDWWKALPKESYAESSFFPVPTMKTCKGMYEFYAKSLCMPLWSELAVNIRPDVQYEWQFSDRVTEADVHGSHQFTGFNFGTSGHLKITSPWFIREKSGVNWLLSQPTYNLRDMDSYTVLPGVLNFKHQFSTNIQLMLNLKEQKTFNIPYRTPLAFFTPMSDKKIEVHRHLLSEQDYKALAERQSTTTFINKYTSFKQAAAAKCPFTDHIGNMK